MKRALLFVIIMLSFFTTVAYAEGIYDIAAQLESFAGEIRLDAPDPDTVLKQVYELEPRLEMYFGGYNGTVYSSHSSVNIKYINSNILLSEIYVAENDEEFEDIITRGLLYCNDSINIVFKNKNSKAVALSDIFESIGEKCPFAEMGIDSYNTSTSDNSITGDSTYRITVRYRYDTGDLLNKKKETERKAFTVVGSNIAYNMPDYMKVKIIHDYIINNCSYARDYDTNKDPDNYTAYGALVKGKAVCQGYTQAAHILLDLCGIENFTISGSSKSEAHTWNAVRLGEDYYHIDITWDDPLTYDGVDMLIYDYYNIDDNKLSEDHTWNREKYKQCTGSFYSYANTLRLMASEGMYTQPYKSFESVFERYRPLSGGADGEVVPAQIYELGVNSWNYKEFGVIAAVLFVILMIFGRKGEK